VAQIVVAPVPGKNAAVTPHLGEKRRSGEWRKHGDLGQFDIAFGKEIKRPLKDLRCVLVKTENHSRLDGNPGLVKLLDRIEIFLCTAESFPCPSEVLVAEGFKADEKAPTSTLNRRFQKLRILRDS